MFVNILLYIFNMRNKVQALRSGSFCIQVKGEKRNNTDSLTVWRDTLRIVRNDDEINQHSHAAEWLTKQNFDSEKMAKKTD